MDNESKYRTLITVLDKLREEAPSEFKSYLPSEDETEKINQARSKTYIHLFLKVIAGISNFRNRHSLVTDGPNDGGIDGYYFDEEKKVLHLVQSKFRTTANGFKNRSITADDLVKMEITRILQGKSTDSRGTEFNSKINTLQAKWKSIKDHANWEYKVIILGNIRNYTDEQVEKLIDNSDFEIYDFNRTYNELVFPMCAGTFFDPKEIKITINLNEKDGSILKRKINTKYGDFPVRVLFVPAREIGRILHKYKNSILKYNPRNYLSLSRNKVNRGIRDSLLSSQTNEFAIYNNGITMIGNNFKLSETTGEEDIGQIIMKRPQIINGGQTAYTLSKIFENNTLDLDNIFYNKEVLLKVIVINNYDEINYEFLQELSNATNRQSKVEEADRRSNDAIQLELQGKIFSQYGLFYERKKGEFFHGISGQYLNKNQIIDRAEFLRAYKAFNGEPRWARQRGKAVLFRKDNFHSTFNSTQELDKMILAYKIFKLLFKEDHREWGYGIRYGKMAIISAIARKRNLDNLNAKNIDQIASENISNIKNSWLDFEDWVKNLDENKLAYGQVNFDFDNYYKGKTIDQNIKEYFEN